MAWMTLKKRKRSTWPFWMALLLFGNVYSWTRSDNEPPTSPITPTMAAALPIAKATPPRAASPSVVDLTLPKVATAAYAVPTFASLNERQQFERRVCKAVIAIEFGRDPVSMFASSIQGEPHYVSYIRPNDGTLWEYLCRVSGRNVVWSIPNGRWRNSYTAGDTEFRFSTSNSDRTLMIEGRHFDGSSTRESFILAAL
ncbi:hypothetical protein [Aureimonas phyllosphaerae]|uniref:Uncharacterized protein n=1 Tax=Aureimonas phyllosphaerae TaxID=1166078 RepID=A0A7W6BZX3_9HYPH|nr:hypothetical protein [Aureimonas phyllosphaerae]MBB3937855.1 hypothetical protein [Aureimonas phyllosphaerae]MBB3961814.1 hypothetical protein [Aureimonas phyllosphaerae]